MPDYGLGNFACKRGFCPADTCFENGAWDPDGGYGPWYDPIEGEYFDDEEIPDWHCEPSAAPQTLDDLVKAVDSDSMSPGCRNQWTLAVLFNTLLSFKGQFAEAYEGWVKDSVNPQLRAFVNPETGHAAKYLDCIITGVGDRPTIKKDCQSAG
jgi:hypothetical protein